MNERLLGQVEAAKLVGCSRDTIVRARRSGRLPGARLRDGRWVIPLADLVAAGLCHPPTTAAEPATPTGTSTAGPSPAVTDPAVELARAEARIAGLERLVARQDDELRFLRLTIDTLAKRSAA